MLEAKFPVYLHVRLNCWSGCSQEFRSFRLRVRHRSGKKGFNDFVLELRRSNAEISYHEPLVSGKTGRSHPSDWTSIIFCNEASVSVESPGGEDRLCSWNICKAAEGISQNL